MADDPDDILRHRGKIEAVINNARCAVELDRIGGAASLAFTGESKGARQGPQAARSAFERPVAPATVRK